MSDIKENVNDQLGPPSTNIWGWKWSWVSLVIIVISFAFLFLIGPKDGWDQEAPEPETTDSTAIESVE